MYFWQSCIAHWMCIHKEIIPFIYKTITMTYFSVLSILKKILRVHNQHAEQRHVQFTADSTHSVSVVCRQFITSSRILPFLCENAGVSFSKSACGVMTSRSINFNIRSCAFSRTTSLLSPVIKKVQILATWQTDVVHMQSFTSVRLWTETMLPKVHKVLEVSQVSA